MYILTDSGTMVNTDNIISLTVKEDSYYNGRRVYQVIATGAGIAINPTSSSSKYCDIVVSELPTEEEAKKLIFDIFNELSAGRISYVIRRV